MSSFRGIGNTPKDVRKAKRGGGINEEKNAVAIQLLGSHSRHKRLPSEFFN